MWKWWIEHLRFALPPLKKPLFQSEGKCKAIDMKMSFFILMEMISQYHNKGFALRLVLKAKVFGTWKWLIRNWPITMTFKPWHSFEGLGGLFCNRQFKGPISKPIDVEGETSNFYGTRKKSRGGFNPANWRKPHRVLICLVPRPHYSARPIRFGSRGPCEAPPVHLRYVTEVNRPRRPGRTPYRD